MTASSFLRKNRKAAKFQNDQRPSRTRHAEDDGVVVLYVVRRAERRFVFEVMRDSNLVAISDEHKNGQGSRQGGQTDLEADGQVCTKGKAG